MRFLDVYGKRKSTNLQKIIKFQITKDGKNIQKTIIIQYIKPEINHNILTFEDVYKMWSKRHFEEISPSAIRTWKSAYNHCSPLLSMNFDEIKVNDLENAINVAKVGAPTKIRMKCLFNMLYKFAIKYEITDKNYAVLCDNIKNKDKKIERTPFTNSQITTLFNNLDYPFVDMILIGIYTGFRPQELTNIKNKDINFKMQTIKGGLKTEAGKNRIVPIHPIILKLIQNRYNPNNEYLFTDAKSKKYVSKLTYDAYRNRFIKVMKHFKMKHKPHDTRHTFITKGKQYKMNEYILKIIVGHSIDDITERVYTHRSIKELKKEIRKIKK